MIKTTNIRIDMLDKSIVATFDFDSEYRTLRVCDRIYDKIMNGCSTAKQSIKEYLIDQMLIVGLAKDADWTITSKNLKIKETIGVGMLNPRTIKQV